jgi:osmotically-inducible protein OsmY
MLTEGKKMRISSRNAGLVSVVLVGLLSGCAAYQKCGFDGCPGDAQLSAAVHERAQASSVLRGNLLHIQVLDGVVYVSGMVDSDFEHEQINALFKSVPGVKSVINTTGVTTHGGGI